jgi:N-acetylmuramoyl-L-alanine amidase
MNSPRHRLLIIFVATLLFVCVALGGSYLVATRWARTEAQGNPAGWDMDLLARVVAAEAQGEPQAGQVGVAAVILNRVRHPSFPNSLSGVIYQPHAFESVSNGLIWLRTPDVAAISASRQALNGWDPTYGAVFFWNPSKPVSPWIWSRQIIVRIGQHVFAR